MFAQEIGIDLGSANTVVIEKRRGILAKEPSVVAVHRQTRAILAIGSEAHKMIGRTPDTILPVRPIRSGVISDMSHSTEILKHMMKKIARSRWLRPRILMTAASGANTIQRRALVEAAISAGASEVGLVDEAVAAGIGAGLPVDKPIGSLLVHMGSGTTTVSVLCLGSTVITDNIDVAGDLLDEAITRYLKREHNLMIGVITAERIKHQLGAALPGYGGIMSVPGRIYTTGMPTAIQIEADEVYSAIREHLDHVDNLVVSVLERTPPELLVDISKTGLTLTGGVASLRGIDKRLQNKTGLPVQVAEDPHNAVALGTRHMLAGKGWLTKLQFVKK